MAKKRANGLGSIQKLSGNRSKAWKVTVSCGYELVTDANEKEKAKQIRKVLGTYATRTEAETVLADYVQRQMGYAAYSISFEALFEKWFAHYLRDNPSESGIKKYQSAFKKSSVLHSRPFRTITWEDMQAIIDQYSDHPSTQKYLVIFFKALSSYAEKHKYIKKDDNNSLYLESEEIKASEKHHPFSKAEIRTIWANIELPFADVLLLQIYLGMRCSELCDIRKDNIHLRDRYIIVPRSKTPAGTNRIIPIHKDIIPLIENLTNKTNTEYLVTDRQGKPYTYENPTALIRYGYNPLLKQIGLINHLNRSHDARYTLRTLLDGLNISQTTIDKILGHKSETTGQAVYTKPFLETLIDAIDQLEILT